ncbi:MAG: O-antigen ligase family protein, partial [Planctomycetota bacterium]
PRFLSRARDVRGAFLLGLLLYAGLLVATLGRATDTFEARRSLVLAATSLLLLNGGAELGPAGRRWFVRGAVLLAILWSGFAVAHWALAAEGHLGGVLGNPGPLSQAALPGAAAGAWLVLRRRDVWFAPGLVAFALFVAHAAAAPVLAGLVAILAILLLGVRLARGGGATERRLAAILAAPTIVAAGAVYAAGGFGGGTAVEREQAAAEGEAMDGGIAARLLIWGRLPALLAAHPFLGTGPGQFAAAFPPHRDPAEAVLSRHGAASELATEAEHPHNDWLHGVVQHGLPGGALWLLFLFLVLRAAVRAARGAGEAHAAAGAAGLAVLVNALVHAPLLVSPASAGVAFPLFGLLLEADGRDAPPFHRMLVVRVGGILSLLAAWAALPLIEHGRATSDYVRAAREIERLTREEPPADPAALARAGEEARAAAARAHRAAPSSVPAAMLRVRLAEGADKLAAIEAGLARRPHSFALLDELGGLHARADRLDAARAAWEAALALDPRHPRILRSLTRLEMHAGRIERGLEHAGRLRADGNLDPGWVDDLGGELLLEGGLAAARAVLAATDERLSGGDPELIAGLAQEAEQADRGRRADVLFALANLEWARGHVAAGDLSTAIRIYRQAFHPTLRLHAGGAPLVRLEMAAAQWRAGRPDDARATLGDLLPTAAQLARLPAWAREALAAAGLEGGER